MSVIQVYADIVGGLSAWNIPTVLGLVIGLIGIASGFWLAQRSRREKDIWFTIFAPRLFVGSALGRPTPSSITITYERADGSMRGAAVVPQVFLSEIGFVNLGRLPVMRADLAKQDPLRVEVTGTKILDVAISNTSRRASGIALGSVEFGTRSAVATIEFDFLDHLDGARIQILTTEEAVRVILRGTVVGMPTGPKHMPERPSGYFERPATTTWKVGATICFLAIYLSLIFLVDLALDQRPHRDPWSFSHISLSIILASLLFWFAVTFFEKAVARFSRRGPLPLDFPSIDLTA
jgi:hypothetical protein